MGKLFANFDFAFFPPLLTFEGKRVSRICARVRSFPPRGESRRQTSAGSPLFTRPSFHVTEKPLQRCTYPSWVVAGKSWVALDRMASRLLASSYNLTILDRNETRLVCHSAVAIDDHRHHHIDRDNQKQFVAKVTRDW